MSTYVPNDSNITVEALDFLHSSADASLRAQLADNPSPTIAQIEKLRKTFSQDIVHAALTLTRLQAKARQKFPRLADRFIYAVPEALEQATDSAVAEHKAARFAKVGAAEIVDLCAGIGGDALALADVAPTIAVDLSAPRLACLRYNAQSKFSLEVRQADVGGLRDSAAFFHIDPARRSQGKRSARYEDMIPGPEFIERLAKNCRGGAVKLSSAVDFDSLPLWGGGHLEIISHDQVVVQAVLWLGELAALFPANTRTATVFKKHRLLCSYTAERSPIGSRLNSLFHPPHPFLYELDPAFTRAQLAGSFAESLHLTPLTIDGGYLAGPQLPPQPALTAFLVHQILPYSESKVLKALAEQSANVEVKTRGKLLGIDTDRLQKRFSHPTPHSAALTVLIFKPIESAQIHAAIATRS